MNVIKEVNPQVIQAVEMTAQSVNQPEVIAAQGAGKSFQSVSHALSLSVQDGVNHLRNVNTIATAAIGMASAKLVETQDPRYSEIIEFFQKMVDTSAQTSKTIGDNAAEVIEKYPHGKSA